MAKVSVHKKQDIVRYVPFLRNVRIRTTIGFILLVLSAALAGLILGKGRVEVIVSITIFAWLPAVFLTDKYVHKYPQRYFTYLIALHLKAAIIMAFVLWILGGIGGVLAAPHDVLWTGFIFFVFADGCVSAFRRGDILDRQPSVVGAALATYVTPDDRSSDLEYANASVSSIDTHAIVSQIRSDVDKPMVEFIETNLRDLQGGAVDVLVLDDLTTTDDQAKSAPVGLLVGRTRINDVRRLNQFLLFCSERITMGGYFVVRYMPIENATKDLKRRYTGLLYWTIYTLHLTWHGVFPKLPWLATLYFSSPMAWLDTLYFSSNKRRNRVLSKAEVWGRLSYCGMQVIAESKGDGDIFLIAQRVGCAVQNKRPSYYPIVALEKVGLDGEIIRMHKIRTMYPFSEFLQRRLFQDHGLTSTGKFANDFRLTAYGRFLRKYWLDELPQIFDWLRGDIKLVGIRATSRHFLSLYPREFIDLYVQIKPGLIPPIFDDSTNGFEQIIDVERAYLDRYWDQPFRTDVQYLIQTFTDIVFRGIRSK